MSQIPFVLVTGFLGSGKTTFLKRLLKKYAPDKKVAIIQNEFAPSNIDGAELKRDGEKFEILEINNGSVFCVCLLNNFIESLKAFIEKHEPDMIFLEASGLSDPIAIAELLGFNDLKKYLYLAKVWTIVDAANFLKQQKLITRLQHQVRIADVVIVNKIDLASKNEIEETIKSIKSLNPFSEILTSSYCNIEDAELVMGLIDKPVAEIQKGSHTEFESCGRPEIGVGVLKSSRSVPKDQLVKLIDFYSKKTIRLKGFANLGNGKGLAIQTSYETMEVKDLDNFNGSTEIIAMGEGFNLSEFSRNYREIAE